MHLLRFIRAATQKQKTQITKSSLMKRIFSILAIACFMALPLISLAQPGGDEDVVDVPIDGGLSFLVAAGIGYGAKKLHSLRNQKEEAPQI